MATMDVVGGGAPTNVVAPPPRVWHPTQDYPGTAFTRSIGDAMAEARLELARQIYEQEYSLCLHAKRLCFHHPETRAPLIFESATPF